MFLRDIPFSLAAWRILSLCLMPVGVPQLQASNFFQKQLERPAGVVLWGCSIPGVVPVGPRQGDGITSLF